MSIYICTYMCGNSSSSDKSIKYTHIYMDVRIWHAYKSTVTTPSLEKKSSKKNAKTASKASNTNVKLVGWVKQWSSFAK